MSPASRVNISPTTRSSAGTSILWPSLMTFAFGDDILLRLLRDCSALKYCTVPKTAFNMRTAIITAVLS